MLAPANNLPELLLLETFTKKNHGICGLILPESKWQYSKGIKARPKIREFIEFVKNTERDFDFLSTNN